MTDKQRPQIPQEVIERIRKLAGSAARVGELTKKPILLDAGNAILELLDWYEAGR